MKRRIGLWALFGFSVACGWVVFGLAMGPEYNLGRWTIVAITVPVSILGRTMPLTYYWVILLNAATYAALGLALEPFWPHRRNLS